MLYGIEGILNGKLFGNDEGGSSSGGIILPTLTNPAGADQILEGYEAVDGSGNKLTGTHVCESGGGGDIDALIDGSVVEIVSNVESVCDYSFYNRPSLVTADFPKAKTVGTNAFTNSKKLVSANFPLATSVGKYCFQNCAALTNANLSSVSGVPTYLFQNCIALTTVNLSAAVNVDNYAFYGCSALAVVDLPLVTTISKSVFQGCSTLTALVLRSETAVSLSATSSFTSTPIASGTGYIYVPSALVDGYKAASNWSTYATQFRALEDYTVDGTITGELDENKI